MAYIFFDQNVMGPAIHKNHVLFQENLSQLIPDKDNQQLLTPFSLYEFCGYKTEHLNIQYKGKNLNEYPFKNCKEFDNGYLVEHIKSQICEEITKADLKEKLEKKKTFNCTEEGIRIIEGYIEKIDLMYDDLIHNLLFDRLSSQINIPEKEDKVRSKFIELCTVLVTSWICQKKIFGSLRMVYKLYSELGKLPITKEQKRDYNFMKVQNKILKMTKGLRSTCELVDCELVHLAFFGWKHDICHIYTCEREEIIKERLEKYYVFVNSIINIIFNHKFYFNFIKRNDSSLWDNIKNNKRPEWKLGKVFILNQQTGEKVTEIACSKESVGKMHQ